MARSLVSRCRSVGLAALLLLAPAKARAQSDTDSALAEALYRQARELMTQAKYAEACPKLAESYRLDPGTGTLLNLATCRELEGKLATAWLLYSDALLAAQRDRRDDREEFAQQHLAELQPKLSRLTLLVPAEADDPELELTLDGTRVATAARGVPTYVDPGSHTVQAKSPGKLAWSQTIEIGATAEQRVVSIPKLEPAQPARGPVARPTVTAEPAPVATPAAKKTRPTPSSVYVAGGATIALAVAATVTGIVYLDKRSSYHQYLVAHDNAPSSEAASLRDSARLDGNLNAALLIATTCGAAATVYLYLARPERLDPSLAVPARSRFSARVAPSVAPGYAGLGVSGGF